MSNTEANRVSAATANPTKPQGQNKGEPRERGGGGGENKKRENKAPRKTRTSDQRCHLCIICDLFYHFSNIDTMRTIRRNSVVEELNKEVFLCVLFCEDTKRDSAAKFRPRGPANPPIMRMGSFWTTIETKPAKNKQNKKTNLEQTESDAETGYIHGQTDSCIVYNAGKHRDIGCRAQGCRASNRGRLGHRRSAGRGKGQKGEVCWNWMCLNNHTLHFSPSSPKYELGG